MARSIRLVESIASDWHAVWPMLDASLQYHARLAGGPLKPGLEQELRSHLGDGIEDGSLTVALGEEGGAAVAMATVHILPRGVTTTGPAALVTDAYVLPEYRGQGFMSALEAQRREWIRDNGCSVVERTILTSNSLAMAAWGHNVWGFVLRRPVGIASSVTTDGVTRITDLDADWHRVWPLLRNRYRGDEATARSRFDRLLSRGGRVYLAGGDPAEGVIAARVSGAPWILDERVCVVRDVATADGAPRDTTDRLLAALNPWLAKKQAATVEVGPIREDLAPPWFRRGFISFRLQLSETF